MKKRMTNKNLKTTYPIILTTGYCNLQTVLQLRNPDYYTAGSYGWNADYYDIGGVLIGTGYRPII